MYCRNDKVEDVCYILVLHLRRKGIHVSPLDSAPLALEEFVAKAKVPKGLKWFAFCLLPPKAIRSSKPGELEERGNTQPGNPALCSRIVKARTTSRLVLEWLCRLLPCSG